MIEWVAGVVAGWALASFHWVYVVPTLARRRTRRNSTTWECPRCTFVVVVHRTGGVTAQSLADLDRVITRHREVHE